LIVDKSKETDAPSWVTEYLKRGTKIAVVDGNQMFNRPGPRLVDAMEFLVGFINDQYDSIPSDFPWKLYSSPNLA
jgi:iron complex transport system substrate-binding protein